MAQQKPEDRPPLAVVVGANVYRLRNEMKPKKWSQERLARESGLSRETIRAIEDARDPKKGDNNGRLSTLDVVAGALGVEPSALLVWDPHATAG